MYEQHFGFSQPPFRITPDPAFFFPGGNRGAVLEALVYAVARGEGMVKVVGEVGSGKTMLCRMLERELPAGCEIIYLANPRLSADEILHAIAFELGLDISADDSRLKAQHAVHDYLLARHADNRRVIMFVEEAQGMPLEALEEIRMLSNLETSSDKLLQIVLFGQPELDDKLALHEIRQLRERITHGFVLAPFARDEITEYVNARVRASGYRGGTLFSAAAVRELERYSGGLLRRINVLADKALLAAFAAHESSVSPAHVRRAAADSEFSRGQRGWRWSRALVAGLIAAFAAGVLLWWLPQQQEDLPAQGAVAPSSPTLPAAPATLAAPAADAGAASTPVIDTPALKPVIDVSSGYVTSAHLRPRTPLQRDIATPAGGE